MTKLLHIPSGRYVSFYVTREKNTMVYEESYSHKKLNRPIDDFIYILLEASYFILPVDSFVHEYNNLTREEFEIIYD